MTFGPSWVANFLQTLLDRAECFIQPVIREGGPTTARASLRQLKNAASSLNLLCAAAGVSQGGIATNIGQFHRNLRPKNEKGTTGYEAPSLP